MIKANAFIFFVFSVNYLVSSNSVNITDVFFDKKLDIIFHKGKLYLPRLTPALPLPNVVTPHQDKEGQKTPHHHKEEEYVSGETFWIYVCVIGCK